MKKKKEKAVKETPAPTPAPALPAKNAIEEKGAIYHINRDKPGYLNLFRKHGSKYKGLKFCHGEMPLDIWDLGIELSGNDDYWRENEYKRYKTWVAKNNPNSSDNKIIKVNITTEWLKRTIGI
jgi:hypothetical protein